MPMKRQNQSLHRKKDGAKLKIMNLLRILPLKVAGALESAGIITIREVKDTRTPVQSVLQFKTLILTQISVNTTRKITPSI